MTDDRWMDGEVMRSVGAISPSTFKHFRFDFEGSGDMPQMDLVNVCW
jgi:hypothetical protein